jgi:hypothetical protein
MKVARLFLFLACAALSLVPAIARAYAPAELEGLLAPIALYPDEVVQDVLTASSAPDQPTRDAAWANLAAYPDLRERISQSPQWATDLGSAWLTQPQDVMATVQALRQRAAAAGTVTTGIYPTVQYYDPWVAYGPYWYPAYTPVYWRPWVAHPVFVTRVVVPRAPVVVRRGPVVVHHAPSVVSKPFVSRPSFHPHAVQPYQRVPESRRQPIAQSRVPHVAPRVAAPRSPQHFSGQHFSRPGGWGGRAPVARGGGRRS